MGVVRTFQHVRLFREMTVIENLLVAQHQHLKSGVFAGLLKTRAFRQAEAEAQITPVPGWIAWVCWKWPIDRREIWLTASSAGWKSPAAW